MQIEYKIKYLKYKKKYLNLKKQKGGVIIGNFHQKDTELAMAEAITHNSLSSQMTQHGLGTGVYGFINYDKITDGNGNYNNDKNELSLFNIKKPVILQNNWNEDGEARDDLANFTSLSTRLNILCDEIFKNNLSITDDIIISILRANYLFSKENDGKIYYDGIPNEPVFIGDIVKIVTLFLRDYNILLQTSKESENYIMMPINYLLYSKGYDGIFNKNDDSGRTGSIKYFYGEYKKFNINGARGYKPEFKKREPLHGELIFLENFY